MRSLILYSKPGCHLCEGLQQKLVSLPIALEVRDITQNPQWFQRYQYEVPVLHQRTEEGLETPLPRPSPRASTAQIAKMIQTQMGPFEA